MYRIDIGFDPDKGYAAVLLDLQQQRQKGIRGNSVEQLTSRIRRVLIDEEGRKRHFPLEHERTPARIITPEGFNGNT
jgi:hypothetical protein